MSPDGIIQILIMNCLSDDDYCHCSDHILLSLLCPYLFTEKSIIYFKLSKKFED